MMVSMERGVVDSVHHTHRCCFKAPVPVKAAELVERVMPTKHKGSLSGESALDGSVLPQSS